MNDDPTSRNDTISQLTRVEKAEERLPIGRRSSFEKTGGVLLSQGVYPQVPSALTGLTSVFGMGTGVTLSLWPPKSVVNRCATHTEDSRASTSVQSKPSAD